jgi:hypothetical protein
MNPDQILLRELQALRADLSIAVNKIFDAAQIGISDIDGRAGDSRRQDEVSKQQFCAIIESCAFEDLANQRIDTIERRLRGETSSAADAHLLNGPALHGQGLDQAAADALFSDADTPVA